MLLWGLDNLVEQFLEASVVGDDCEGMVDEVLGPLLDGRSDGGQFSDVC